MNTSVLFFFIVMVAALTAVIIKVNSREGNDALKVIANVVVGICMVVAIMFLPFGDKAPESLYGRALSALNSEKPVEPQEPAETATPPEPEKEEEPEERELPDFIVYECDDYYIGMDKEEHIMEIVPSEERLEDAKATGRLVYHDFSDKYVLDGRNINVYAARLSGDPGFVCIVVFEEYYQDDVNSEFWDDGNLFRVYDEEKGYTYGYAYTYDSISSARNFTYNMNNKSVAFRGMYDALKLDRKYYDYD